MTDLKTLRELKFSLFNNVYYIEICENAFYKHDFETLFWQSQGGIFA